MASATVQVNVRVAPDLYDAVKKLAVHDRSSVSAVVNEALTRHVADRRGKGKA